MIDEKNVQVVILARGGSKGLPRKNILPLAGRPLIGWAIAAARDSVFVDDVIVSTDDAEIADVARSCGARTPFRRPDDLASDVTSSIEALTHAVTSQKRRFDVTLLMQPTSPLVSPEDVDAAICAVVRDGAPSAVTVCAADKPPHWLHHRSASGELTPFLTGDAVLRRQDRRSLYSPTGAVYAALTQTYLEAQTLFPDGTVGVIVPPERAFDIDTQFDFDLAEAWLERAARRRAKAAA